MYCPYCGVKYNKKQNCSICGRILVKNETDIKTNDELFPKNHYNKCKRNINIYFIWFFFTLIFTIIMSVLITAIYQNLAMGQWLRYPIVSIIYLWLFFTTMVFFRKKYFLILVFLLTFLNIIFSLFDFYKGSAVFFIEYGLPFLIILILIFFLLYFFIQFRKLKLMNLITTIIYLVSMVLISIGFIRDFYYLQNSWFLFIFLINLPIASILFYQRLKKNNQI